MKLIWFENPLSRPYTCLNYTGMFILNERFQKKYFTFDKNFGILWGNFSDFCYFIVQKFKVSKNNKLKHNIRRFFIFLWFYITSMLKEMRDVPILKKVNSVGHVSKKVKFQRLFFRSKNYFLKFLITGKKFCGLLLSKSIIF